MSSIVWAMMKSGRSLQAHSSNTVPPQYRAATQQQSSSCGSGSRVVTHSKAFSHSKMSQIKWTQAVNLREMAVVSEVLVVLLDQTKRAAGKGRS
jgi:hypothetical protein